MNWTYVSMNIRTNSYWRLREFLKFLTLLLLFTFISAFFPKPQAEC